MNKKLPNINKINNKITANNKKRIIRLIMKDKKN